MDTAAAALQADVTVATIRYWCRYGAVAAIKRAGRWVISASSLAHRITLGAMRARKAATMTTTTGTLVQIRGGEYGIRGDADALAAAYADGAPVTPTNAPYAQDRIYLGDTQATYGDFGITTEQRGLAYTREDGQAVYHIDLSRLAKHAPAFAAALQQLEDEADAADAAMRARDDEYLNPRYM
ncbi:MULTISPECIES: hypothetical protein [Streptomycetaceae]|uniref:hypothetical protein n=2 Tax=Kitasatosporales TaxID=85011 RepID=UPI0003750AC7|nr:MULTISPECIES: hypothetical protein [Streptomycetaceae]